jgi:hypothetical protein
VVETGRLHARWDAAICSEFHDWPGPEGFGEVDGKDVGSTTATVDPDDNNLLHLMIENGYPSYSVDCEVEYVNDGTIPWVIRGTTIVSLSPNLHNCVLTGNQTKTLSCQELTVVLVDGVGSQIDPGDGVASSVRVHVEQPAEQNAEYNFAIQICVAQWNEAATFNECVARRRPTSAAAPGGGVTSARASRRSGANGEHRGDLVRQGDGLGRPSERPQNRGATAGQTGRSRWPLGLARRRRLRRGRLLER